MNKIESIMRSEFIKSLKDDSNIRISSYVSCVSDNLIGESYCDVHHGNPMDCLTLFDMPNQHNLSKDSKLCGYIEKDGTYHGCNTCEHEKVIRQIIWENEEYRKKYFDIDSDWYNRKPIGMLQEEYFAMKELGFVKISSFRGTPNDMVVFFYGKMSSEQSDIVYPR